MPAFDELLELEDTISKLTNNIAQGKSIVLELSTKKAALQRDLKKTAEQIDTLQKNLDFLVYRAKVVSLREYTDAKLALGGATMVHLGIFNMLKEVLMALKENASVVSRMKRELKEARRAHSTYNKVLPFRVP